MLSPSVKTTSGKILAFRKLGKTKQNNSKICLVLDLGQLALFREEY